MKRLVWILSLASCANPRDAAQETPAEARHYVNLLAISEEPAGMHPVPGLNPIVVDPDEKRPPVPPNDPRVIAHEAVRKLTRMGTAAFPALIDGLADRRQSICLRVSLPCTAGKTCFFIIQNQVDVEIPRPEEYRYYFLMMSSLPEWWRERQGRSLRELRIECRQFALALAEVERDERMASRFREELAGLGAEDHDPRLARFRNLSRGLTPAEDPDALIESFRINGADYADRRFARERSGRAWWKLYQKGRAGFPAMLAHLEDPVVGAECFELLQYVVEGSNIVDQWPRLALLSRTSVHSWWKERVDWPLKELQREAARHHLKTAQATRFDDPQDKENLLQFLRDRLDSLRRE